jgi:hypothetical protein
MIKENSIFLFIFILFFVMLSIYYFSNEYKIYNKNIIFSTYLFPSKMSDKPNYNNRQFKYQCKDLRRIGGHEEIIKQVDGSWFVCFDKGLELIENKCNVLSFGVNLDYSFDQQSNYIYKCQVESFDPFVEAYLFQSIRNKSEEKNSPTLLVNQNPLWRFHRIGIVSPNEISKNKNQIGWMASFDEILKYIQFENKVIDLIKMDIEAYEHNILNTVDLDYLCKYVKQFHIKNQNHKSSLKFIITLEKLGKCFDLFKRDTKTEFQAPKIVKIDMNLFNYEFELINQLVCNGELFFINKNFIVLS